MGLKKQLQCTCMCTSSGEDTQARAADDMVHHGKAQSTKVPTALLVSRAEAARNLAATTVGLCNKRDTD